MRKQLPPHAREDEWRKMMNDRPPTQYPSMPPALAPAPRPLAPAPRPTAPAPTPPPADGIDLAPGVKISESALRFQFARSRGPGGQNVNKVNTKAELWAPLKAIWGLRPRAADRLAALAGKRLTALGEIHLAADSERSQEQNRLEVLERLRVMVRAAVHEPKIRRKLKPSRAAKARRLDAKRRRSQIKSSRGGTSHSDD